MKALLIVLTLLEIAAVLGVLVGYLLVITGALRRTTRLLAKVSFGVRAIETQCEAVGPWTLRLNEQLSGISSGLTELTRLAEDATRTTTSTSADGR